LVASSIFIVVDGLKFKVKFTNIVQVLGRDTALPCPVFHFPEANNKDFFTAENAEGAEKEKGEKLII
jgi:hypothetical protein